LGGTEINSQIPSEIERNTQVQKRKLKRLKKKKNQPLMRWGKSSSPWGSGVGKAGGGGVNPCVTGDGHSKGGPRKKPQRLNEPKGEGYTQRRPGEELATPIKKEMPWGKFQTSVNRKELTRREHVSGRKGGS